MSQRFIRCVHCGLPHELRERVCPSTGKAILLEQRRNPRNALDRDVHPHPPSPSRPFPRAKPVIEPARLRNLVGETIGGKYIVKSILGEGGMGTVYEAEQVPVGRRVAIKVLHPHQAEKTGAVTRFRQEARAAAALGHPNICRVYDFGTHEDGRPYLVMEKLIGQTLADRIAAEGALPFRDVIDALIEVLSGLSAAHEKGIVHRDVKPENVFLSRTYTGKALVKLVDFGVSKVVGPLFGGKPDDTELTRAGSVMGTPYYLSPEQARGDRDLDARVDLYACGVILYEALTGRRPFTTSNYKGLLVEILSCSPRRASELRPALPAAFDSVIERAMARDRDDRYGTAAEFQRALRALRDLCGKPRSGDIREPPSPTSASRGGPTPVSIEIAVTFSDETPILIDGAPTDATEPQSRPPLLDAAEESVDRTPTEGDSATPKAPQPG